MLIDMPSDALTVAVTTGLGVSVLAGLLSGICYVLSQGLKRKGSHPVGTPWHCGVCGSQFRSIQGVLEVEKVVKCAKCQQKVCRIRCSRRDPMRGWICQICQQPETWFKTILNAIHPSKSRLYSKMEAGAVDELDDDLMELRKKEREQVREFIERLVESLLGGNLDEVNVGRLYNDTKYDSLFDRYHADLSNAITDLGSSLHISISNLPITGQSPCTAHAALKNLIQRFSSEAGELPELKRIQDHPAVPEESTTDRTYEDLLSTAIINKVVENYQNGPRSSTGSLCSRSSRRSKQNSSKEYFFSDETLNDKWKNGNLHGADDTSSISSIDEWVRSESSLGSAKYVDRISLTIRQHIDDGGSSGDEASVGSNHGSGFLDTEDNWNENWYLQKRRLTSSHSPVPVPMLVPNPLSEAKVFIGDREANDISDAESDYGEHEVVPDIKHILVNSRTIIGGKNIIENVEDLNQDDVLDGDETVVDVEIHKEAVEALEEEIEIKAEDNMDESLLSIDSNTEKDTEYTEQYASLPRTIVKEPKPTPRMSKVNESQDLASKEHHDVETYEEDGNMSEVSLQEHLFDDETPDDQQIFEGSYSRKEKEKWRNSVEMPNNPYSPENLEMRLSSRSSSSSVNSLYGRDYYIKQAAKSAGSRKKDDIPLESEMQSFGQDSEDTLVTAVPALVTPDDEEPPSNGFGAPAYSSTPPPPVRPNQLDISSDSDLSIERIYNLQSGKVIQNVGGITQEFVVESKSPECTKYVQKDFDSYVDENHNTMDAQKREFLRSLTCESDQSTPAMEDIVASIYDKFSEVPVQPPTPVSYELTQTVPTESEIAPKLKKTLDKFDDITNEFETPNKTNQSKTPIYHLVPETPQEGNIEDNNNVEEFGNILKMKDMPAYEFPARYFGDVKTFFESKVSTNTSDYSEEDIVSESKDFSLEYSTDITEDGISRPESRSISTEADPEIVDLKEKKLVKDLLGRYSKSFPNVSTVVQKKPEPEIKRELSMDNVTTIDDNSIQNDDQLNEGDVDHIPSVQNLKKMFDRDTEGKKDSVNCSLTARSLPRSVRQQLKSDEDLSIKQENQSAESAEESLEELPADITRSRIAFFENLERKKFRTAE